MKRCLARLALLLSLLGPSFVLAQSYTINGEVIDAQGQPLSFVNILLKQADQTVDFTTSDDTGRFSFELSSLGEYSLSLSYIGYFPQSVDLVITCEKNIYETAVVLEEKTELLKEVTVVGEKLQAQIQDDTISYNVDVLADGTEEDLGELMNKLPGVQVDENGKVLANGKKIDHLLVNGQKFFDNQEQLATKNLSADMVSKIDFINNYQHGDNLSLQNSGETALNIELKEEYAGKIVGNLKGQGGLVNKGLGHANLFYFKDKFNFSFVGDANNLGEASLSIQDYITLKGGIGHFQEDNNGGNVSIVDTELPEFVLSNGENRKERTAYFSGVNLSFSPTDKLEINAHSFFNKMKELRLEETFQSMIFTKGEFKNEKEQNLDLDIFTAQVKVNYKPSKKSVLKYKANLLSDQDDILQQQLFSGDFTNQLSEAFDNTGEQFSQKLSFEREGNLLWKFALGHEINNKRSLYNLNSQELIFTDLFNSKTFLQQRQFDQTLGYLKAGFDKALNNHILSFQLSSQIDNQEIRNNLQTEQELTAGLIQQNWINSAQLTIGKNLGKFQYKVGLAADLWDQKTLLSQSQLLISPQLFVKYAFSSAQYLSINYSNRPTLNFLNELTNFTYLKNFRTIVAPSAVDATLPSFNNNLDFTYYNFDLFAGRLSVFNIHLSQINNALSKNITPGFFYDRYESINLNKQRNLTAFGMISQKIKRTGLTATLKGSYTLNDFFNYIENSASKVIVEKINADFDLSTNFKKSNLNFSLGIIFDQTTNTFKEVNLENTFNHLYPFGTIRYITEDKKFVSVIKAGFSINNTLIAQSSPFILSPRITYKLNKKMALSLEGDNILYLRTQRRVETTNNETLISNRYFYPIAGYLTLGLRYSFN